MKRIAVIILLFLQLLCSGCTHQRKPGYGANKGKYFTIFDTKIYYEEYGDGPVLILLQGGSGSIKDFEKCIPELSKHYRIIAPDTPGQGRSELADSLSYPLLAEYMSQFIDSLKLDDAYIMGWSDGGIVGLLLAEKRPDKVRKVLASGVNYGLKGAVPSDKDLSTVKPEPLDEWQKKNRKWIEEYTRTLPRDWRKFRNDLNKMWYAEEYFSKSVLERINVPVMITMGDHDNITLEHGLEIHRLIKNSQFCVLPNTTHAVFIERPELITRIAMDFFVDRYPLSVVR